MRSVLLDCETTGLTRPSVADLTDQPRIIELGIVVVFNSTIIEEYEQLIHPGQEVSEEITKITGITNEMLVGKPTFPQIIDELAAMFEGSDAFWAHNAPFDKACMDYEIQRVIMNDMMRPPFPWPREICCSAQEFTHEFGFRPKLTQLYERKMGRPLDQTHRALDDIKALAEVLMKEGLL